MITLDNLSHFSQGKNILLRTKPSSFLGFLRRWAQARGKNQDWYGWKLHNSRTVCGVLSTLSPLTLSRSLPLSHLISNLSLCLTILSLSPSGRAPPPSLQRMLSSWTCGATTFSSRSKVGRREEILNRTFGRGRSSCLPHSSFYLSGSQPALSTKVLRS